MTEADWMGEGGGCGLSIGDITEGVSAEDGEVGDTAGSECLLLRADLLDLIVSLSDLSPSPFDSKAEVRGLSVFPEPGILDRKVLKDLVESLVSDLLKEGRDGRPSGPAALFGREVLLPSLDGWLPIVFVFDGPDEPVQMY